MKRRGIDGGREGEDDDDVALLLQGISTGSIAKQQLQAARSVSAGGHRFVVF